ncbi:MAG TPA: DUF881 domain-containing protein [Firmicutes bacterium]|nr:DUF881 domain-containing protein [Bacillota bacterium]
MRFQRSWQISIALICLFLGLLVVVQFRTQSQRTRLSTARSEVLLNLYEDTETHRRSLERQVATLRAELAKAAEGRSLLAGMTAAVSKARKEAGLTELVGPGIVVTLNDSDREVRPGQDQDLYVIHDEDLLLVINELLAGGAEGVAINGQRWTARTEIRCAGPTASVNRTRIGAPFVIKAVGDPDTLESAMRLRGGVLDALRTWGIKVRVERVEKMALPAYTGSLEFEYARPVGQTAGTERSE